MASPYTPSFGKMGKYSAPAASTVRMGSFNSTPSITASHRALQDGWRKPASLPPSHRISFSSPPHSHSSLTTRPKPAGNCPWDALGAARLSGRQAPKRTGATLLLECVVGRVVLLPGKQLIPTTSVVHIQARGSPWDHPQVITKTWEDGNGVKFVKLRTCTSFRGIGITRKKEHQRHYFVEAEECQLTRESDTFNKQTYVNCSPGGEFTVEFEHLTPWPGSVKSAIQFSPAALVSFNECEERRDSCN